MKHAVYLDYNASAPLRPGVSALICDILATHGNASSIHASGRAARAKVETARDKIATAVGAAPNQVVFNSGATEGANTVLKSFAQEKIAILSSDHPATQASAPNADAINVKESGLIDVVHYEEVLAGKPALVSFSALNSETGVIQPIQDSVAAAKKAGAFVHIDATQLIGRLPFDFESSGADFVTFSAHKLGGPQGVGALVTGPCLTRPPRLLCGGGQERSQRAGTENVAGIAGFGLATSLAVAELDTYAQLAVLQKRLEIELKGLHAETIIFGESAPRSPNTTCFAVPGISAEAALIKLDLLGLELSSGSACSSGRVTASHVLKAMGVPDALAGCALRISTGWFTTEADIDRFLDVWRQIVRKTLP